MYIEAFCEFTSRDQQGVGFKESVSPVNYLSRGTLLDVLVEKRQMRYEQIKGMSRADSMLLGGSKQS